MSFISHLRLSQENRFGHQQPFQQTNNRASSSSSLRQTNLKTCGTDEARTSTPPQHLRLTASFSTTKSSRPATRWAGAATGSCRCA